ncbi:hypothetical protein FY528_01980 [Hymenobacter lutimineralis]|uniref:DNA topoisomerase IV n=1 Tax=Hymenobacter lutimineralis TaxID=2606448 RepID=A0A5D6VGM2_9BACT|nr:hypothetical protein FY528_01980 [Hymenobacter lutimineralis]
MKGVLILSFFFICFCSNSALGQRTDCHNFRNGKFKLTDRGNTTIITRSGGEQTEVHNNSTKPTSYKVKWLDDCTYVLIPNQDVFDKYPNMPKDAMLTVRISSTTDSSYTQTSTSNFSELVFTSKMVKIK